jgi:hypothetical protein
MMIAFHLHVHCCMSSASYVMCRYMHVKKDCKCITVCGNKMMNQQNAHSKWSYNWFTVPVVFSVGGRLLHCVWWLFCKYIWPFLTSVSVATISFLFASGTKKKFWPTFQFVPFQKHFYCQFLLLFLVWKNYLRGTEGEVVHKKWRKIGLEVKKTSLQLQSKEIYLQQNYVLPGKSFTMYWTKSALYLASYGYL